ncbi:MAG: replication-associated protein [Gemykibivirus minti1]|uniref:replication-associated protein n=1 Tax=Genomoviridae sp. TaxID=2202565 RepID=UPI0024820DA7|nr:MAG: replication-associated protein [Genomoviridae sp.]QCW23705.1 MAG: replication-associated protein [Genomoviridae sp.]
MPFLFERRYALLTYAQCGTLDPFEVSNLLSELGGECIIGRENHDDGGIHLHAFVDFGRKYRTRNPRQFDVGGYHPNVLPAQKTPEKMYDYATKDGDIVAGGLERPDGGSIPKSRDRWGEIILAETRDDFFELCAAMDPRSLACSFPSLCRYADWRYRVDPGRYETPKDFVFDTSGFPELDDWRGQSLVLIGPSRMGKTAWARSLGHHAYFGGLFSLDEDITDVQFAVFDDIQGGLEFFHAYKFWLGHQHSFYATDKYKGKKLITWGKPAIWCSNTDPRADKGADADWLDANCTFVFIDSKLY